MPMSRRPIEVIRKIVSVYQILYYTIVLGVPDIVFAHRLLLYACE